MLPVLGPGRTWEDLEWVEKVGNCWNIFQQMSTISGVIRRQHVWIANKRKDLTPAFCCKNGGFTQLSCHGTCFNSQPQAITSTKTAKTRSTTASAVVARRDAYQNNQKRISAEWAQALARLSQLAFSHRRSARNRLRNQKPCNFLRRNFKIDFCGGFAHKEKDWWLQKTKPGSAKQIIKGSWNANGL